MELSISSWFNWNENHVRSRFQCSRSIVEWRSRNYFSAFTATLEDNENCRVVLWKMLEKCTKIVNSSLNCTFQGVKCASSWLQLPLVRVRQQFSLWIEKLLKLFMATDFSDEQRILKSVVTRLHHFSYWKSWKLSSPLLLIIFHSSQASNDLPLKVETKLHP